MELRLYWGGAASLFHLSFQFFQVVQTLLGFSLLTDQTQINMLKIVLTTLLLSAVASGNFIAGDFVPTSRKAQFNGVS